jgi:metallo-beta-lactamase class B
VSSLLAQNPPPSSSDWTEPFPPYKIAGNLYYVGSRGLASYLVATPQGHILINSNLESSPPQIRASVEQLGFKWADVNILLISHAHWDHNAGSDTIKKETGAVYLVMAEDAHVVESGGRTDPNYGHVPTSHYPPTKVNRRLHDGEVVELSDTKVTAYRTPGHTQGCTTFSVRVKDGDKLYDAVIIGSPNVNGGYKLVNHPTYPQIADDYARTFEVLNKLQCDIFLGAHGNYFGMEAKYTRLKAGEANAFFDPEGYKKYVAEREQAFRTELAKQQAAARTN